MKNTPDLLETAAKFLHQNKIIVLPTKNIYYLVAKASPENYKKFNQLKQSSTDLNPTYFFRSVESLLQNVHEVSSDINFLLHTLAPGPITLILKSKGFFGLSRDLACTIPSQPEVQELLAKFKDPLIATSANPTGFPPATNLQSAKFYFEKDVELILNFEQAAKNSLEATVLDCTEEKKVKVIRPGILDLREVIKILPKYIKLEKTYLDYKEKPTENLSLIKQKNLEIITDSNSRVVLGTKEKLKEVFNLGDIGYFHTLKWNNYTLINIGSQTYSQSILHNLYSNIFIANNLEAKEKILLWQNLGKNHWNEVIEYTLKRYTKEVANAETIQAKDEQEQVEATLGGILNTPLMSLNN